MTEASSIEVIKEIFEASGSAGMIGGLVAGIMATDNGLRVPGFRRGGESDSHSTLDLGSLGDLLVGGAAGFAIVFFLYFGGAQPKSQDDVLHVAPIGLMAGIVSRRVLPGIADVTIKNLTATTKNLSEGQNRLEEHVQNLDQMKELIQEGEQYLQSGEAEKSDRSIRIGKYESARQKFEAAVKKIPGGHPLAYISLGRTLKRLAEEAIDEKKREGLLREAIDAASKAISADPSYERGYYNRSCYKALSGAPVADVLKDLRTAIGLFDSNRVFARSDPDFDAIRSDPAFVALTEARTKAAAT